MTTLRRWWTASLTAQGILGEISGPGRFLREHPFWPFSRSIQKLPQEAPRRHQGRRLCEIINTGGASAKEDLIIVQTSPGRRLVFGMFVVELNVC